jgi:hypothetical protein
LVRFLVKTAIVGDMRSGVVQNIGVKEP